MWLMLVIALVSGHTEYYAEKFSSQKDCEARAEQVRDMGKQYQIELLVRCETEA